MLKCRFVLWYSNRADYTSGSNADTIKVADAGSNEDLKSHYEEQRKDRPVSTVTRYLFTRLFNTSHTFAWKGVIKPEQMLFFGTTTL